MKRAILFCALLALLMGTNAQETTSYKEKHPYKDWVKIAPKLDDAFLTTPEAIRIADNVLLYQHTTGGWPKNVYMPAELTADEYKKVLAAKNNVNESTIDNSATSTEIRYLSRIYLATRIEKYKDAALEGIRYLLKAQYPNWFSYGIGIGCYPQLGDYPFLPLIQFKWEASRNWTLQLEGARLSYINKVSDGLKWGPFVSVVSGTWTIHHDRRVRQFAWISGVAGIGADVRSEEHTSELQSRE